MKHKIISLSCMVAAFIFFSCTDDAQLPPGSQPPTDLSGNVAGPPSTIARIKDIENSLCGRILIDASHDGGVWWFPQAGSFDREQPHQGLSFEQRLQQAGFEVDVLGRDQQVTTELLGKYQIIFRINGFEPYSKEEVDAYQQALDRGITLLLFSDHQRFDQHDELAELAGVKFNGEVSGRMNVMSAHRLTENLDGQEYGVGAHITTIAENTDLEGLVAVGNKTVIGIVEHSTSRIFVMGDSNTIEQLPDTFVANIAPWIAEQCGVVEP
jgi:hypothetical protein